MRARPMQSLALTAICAALLLGAAGCGGDDEQSSADERSEPRAAQADDAMAKEVAMAADGASAKEEAMTKAAGTDKSDAVRPRGEDGLRVAAQAAQIVAKDSEFGTVLFDANGQVVYAFEADERNTSNCVDEECVTAWPPVLTKDAPTAGPGARANLLGRRSVPTDRCRSPTPAGRSTSTSTRLPARSRATTSTSTAACGGWLRRTACRSARSQPS